jgi:hypothetical protein
MRQALASTLLVCEAFVACGGATDEQSGHDVGNTPDPVSAASPASTKTSAPATPTAPAAEPQDCSWDVDALLRHVGAPVVAGRVDCGPGGFGAGYQKLADCFAAAPADPGAQFTINDCTYCSIPTTYVSAPGPSYFAVTLEDDQYGDAFREARVRRCREIQIVAYGASCTYPEQLYSCKEPRR